MMQKRAAVPAAILHLQVGPRIAGRGQILRRQVGMGKAIVHQHRNAARGRHLVQGHEAGSELRSNKSRLIGRAGIAGSPHPRNHLSQQPLVAVADHRIHTRQPRHLLGSALRIASGHHHACRGILPLHPAQVRARRPFGFGGHGAGVQHHHGRISRRARRSHRRGRAPPPARRRRPGWLGNRSFLRDMLPRSPV